MYKWDQIVKSNVFEIFRNICHKWWGIDIKIYDEYGNWKNGGLSCQNLLCNLANSSANGARACLQNYKKNLKEFNSSQKPFTYKCHAGLKVAAVPIFANGNYAGAIVGAGILAQKMKIAELKKRIDKLAKLDINKPLAKQSYDKLSLISADSKEYLLDFIELIARELVASYELLHEKEEIIKRQSVLLERAYNAKYKGIIGTSAAMKKIFDILELVENSEIPVLIEGESGVGKELLASAVHYNSPRRDQMFVILNCSTFNDTLLSSELFGHEKGAFTGAISEKSGLFEIADGGSIFLDEIGDMKLETQAQILRVLENGTFYKVGGANQIKVDVRIIAATNKRLKKQVDQGLFRTDLFYRINNIHIKMPPLRERREDIIALINYFLESYSETHNIKKKEISKDVMELLTNYDWPGNIRELKNLIESLIILSGKNETIETRYIPLEILGNQSLKSDHLKPNPNGAKLKEIIRSVEKEVVSDMLQTANWNKSAASKKLGISRAALNNKIAQYNIQMEPAKR